MLFFKSIFNKRLKPQYDFSLLTSESNINVKQILTEISRCILYFSNKDN